MNKKLVYINIIFILLVIVVYILGYYFMNYLMNFDLFYLIKECGLEYLAVIFAIAALVSYLISSLDFKKLNFKAKFLRVFPFINALFILFFIFQSTDKLLKTQRKISMREHRYSQQAEEDIKNDNVTLRYAGGLSLSVQSTQTIHHIDSIRKKYGIAYKNTGCVVDLIDSKAQEKYIAAVYPYLEKRNGKGWELRMEKEITSLASEK